MCRMRISICFTTKLSFVLLRRFRTTNSCAFMPTLCLTGEELLRCTTMSPSPASTGKWRTTSLTTWMAAVRMQLSATCAMGWKSFISTPNITKPRNAPIPSAERAIAPTTTLKIREESSLKTLKAKYSDMLLGTGLCRGFMIKKRNSFKNQRNIKAVWL